MLLLQLQIALLCSQVHLLIPELLRPRPQRRRFQGLQSRLLLPLQRRCLALQDSPSLLNPLLDFPMQLRLRLLQLLPQLLVHRRLRGPLRVQLFRSPRLRRRCSRR